MDGPPSERNRLIGDDKGRRRRRIAVAGGAAALIAMIIVVVLVVTLTNSRKPVSSPTANPTSTAPANVPPFTGVYRADFGPSSTEGKPDQGATPSTGQWAVRSTCRSTGCVATATATGGPTLQSAFRFDDIGGQWHAVSAASATSAPPGVSGFSGCTFPAEYWTVITLQRRPDGTLTGQYRAASQIDPCVTERTVTFTRIGDVDPNSLPDPASQAPRVASPAAAWHGRYRGIATPEDDHQPSSWNASVQTDCIPTGERCITYARLDPGAEVSVFADGKWVMNYDGKDKCNGVDLYQDKVSWELPLPQPPEDPITSLTGHGHREVIGTACARNYNEWVEYDRTGD
jgi:hypothetical protein